MRTVLCRLPHGVVIEDDGRSVLLEFGINDTAPVGFVERWLERNARLACVRQGQVTIADDGRPDPVVFRPRSKHKACAA